MPVAKPLVTNRISPAKMAHVVFTVKDDDWELTKTIVQKCVPFRKISALSNKTIIVSSVNEPILIHEGGKVQRVLPGSEKMVDATEDDLSKVFQEYVTV